MQNSKKSLKKSGSSRVAAVETAVRPSKSTAAKKPAVKRKYVTFQVQSRPGSKVYLAGDFNDWHHLGHELCDYEGNGIYQAVVALEPGSYEYKFHINDIWCVDPGNPNFTPNPMGTLNSIIVVE